jgi:hypothetical protein
MHGPLKNKKGDKIKKPALELNKIEFSHVQFSIEILRVTKNFVLKNGPFDLKPKNDDEVRSMFLERKMISLQAKRRKSMEKKKAARWLKENPFIEEEEPNPIKLRRRREPATCSEGPKRKKVMTKPSHKTKKSKIDSDSSYSGSTSSGLSDSSKSDADKVFHV